LVIAAAVFLVLAVVALTVATVRVTQAQAETARARDREAARARSLRELLYFQDIGLAWQAWQNGELARMRDLLDRHEPEAGQDDLRGFEWYYLRRRSRGVLHEVARVTAHEGDAYCVAYALDGRILASGGKDGMIRIWDAGSLRRRSEWNSKQGEVNEVAFAPDGKTLASAGDDGTVRLWDLAGRQLAKLQPTGGRHELAALAYSPDGRTVAAAGEAGWVWTWDLTTAAVRAARDLKAGAVHYLAFAPNGRMLAVAADRSSVFLLDPATLRDLHQVIQPFGGEIESVAFSRDGRTLAIGTGWGGQVLLWDLADRLLRTILRGHDGGVKSMTFSPDDILLASGANDGRVRLWDARTGTMQDSVPGHGDRVWSTAFAPDGQRLATAGRDGAVKLWEVRRDGLRAVPVVAETPNEDSVNWVAFAPDGQTLLTWAECGVLRRWDALSGRPGEPSRRPAASLVRPVLAPGGRLVTVGWGGRGLQVWDLPGRAAQVYRHVRPISAVAVAPDGKRLAFCDAPTADPTVALWLWEVGSARPRELSRVPPLCRYLVFAPDGGTLAVAHSSRVLILDVAAGRLATVLSGHEKDIIGLGFSPDGRSLATSSQDGTVRLWDLPTQSGAELPSAPRVG
jgi:WD40 repeat protein